ASFISSTTFQTCGASSRWIFRPPAERRRSESPAVAATAHRTSQIASAKSAPNSAPSGWIATPAETPTLRRRNPISDSRIQDRRVFALIASHRQLALSHPPSAVSRRPELELYLGGFALRRVRDLEERRRLEVEHARQDVRRERLELRVVLHHGVVVELP